MPTNLDELKADKKGLIDVLTIAKANPEFDKLVKSYSDFGFDKETLAKADSQINDFFGQIKEEEACVIAYFKQSSQPEGHKISDPNTKIQLALLQLKQTNSGATIENVLKSYNPADVMHDAVLYYSSLKDSSCYNSFNNLYNSALSENIFLAEHSASFIAQDETLAGLYSNAITDHEL